MDDLRFFFCIFSDGGSEFLQISPSCNASAQVHQGKVGARARKGGDQRSGGCWVDVVSNLGVGWHGWQDVNRKKLRTCLL